MFERADVLLGRERAHCSSPLPSASPSASSASAFFRPLETGLPPLDARLAALAQSGPLALTQGHAASLSQGTATATGSSSTGNRNRNPHARILEITGPTASGKTAFIISCAVHERLDALFSTYEAVRGALGGASKGKGKARSMSWKEWDEDVVRHAAQVMIIDTEGACTPEKLLVAAKAVILSTPHLTDLAHCLPSDSDDEIEDKEAFVLPLVQAVLEGIQLCLPATRAQFLATIMLLDPHISNGLRNRNGPRPSEDKDDSANAGAPIPSSLAPIAGQGSSHNAAKPGTAESAASATAAEEYAMSFSALPPNTSLLLIDSLSGFLRATPTTKAEREERAHIYAALGQLVGRIRRYNQACWNQLSRAQTQTPTQAEQGGSTPGSTPRSRRMLSVVASVQMSVKMVPQDGSLANFEPAGAGGAASRLPDKMAMLVPQIQIVHSSSSSSNRGGDADGSGAHWKGEGPKGSGAKGGGGGGDTYEDPSASMIGSGLTTSVLGEEVWRIVLFRAGGGGHRFIQLYQLPKSVETSLSNARILRASQQKRSAEDGAEEEEEEEDLDELSERSWKRWIHFVVDHKSGLPREPSSATQNA